MTVDLKHLTYDVSLAMPEMMARYSIIDGELVVAAASTLNHQRVVLRLALKLTPFVTERHLGGIFVAPVDTVIRREPLRTRQPDLLFVSQERRSIMSPQAIEGGPDLVIEILSPANTQQELQEKLQDYQAIGVRKAWIIAPEARTVEVLQLSAEGLQRSGLYGLGDTIASQVLRDRRLAAEEIFAEL
jgi:Uma2 family endonuclease